MSKISCLVSRSADLICAAPVCGAILVSQARAQESSPPQLQFYLTPYLWIAGVSGTSQTPFPGIPTQSASASFGQVLSHLDAIPIMGGAEVRYDWFGLLTDIIEISVKTRAISR